LADQPLEAPLHEPPEANSAAFAEAASGVSSQPIVLRLPRLNRFRKKKTFKLTL
jgi:hypothetical protein